MAFTVTPDRQLVRTAGGSVRHLRISIAAPEAPPRAGRSPVNLAVVLDRSGSMSGEKLARAREAGVHTVRSLAGEDRFSVVAFDNEVDVVVPSSRATPETRAEAERHIQAIHSRGTTALFDGWLRGCEQVAEHLGGADLGRTLLLTDGLANVGVVEPEAILGHVRALRARGISTSTFGVGADFDESLLQRMAEAGGGNFYFIEQAAQIPDFVAGEVGEALQVVARDVRIVLEVPAGATVRSLNGHPVEQAGDTWTVALGALVSGQLSDAVVTVRLPAGERGATAAVRVRVMDRDGALGGHAETVRFRFASSRDNDAQPRDREVDRLVATLYAAGAERSAAERNRHGDFDGARRELDACARRIRGYAGDDPALLRIGAALEAKARVFGDDMDPVARKRSMMASSASLKDRTARGGFKSARGSLVVLPALTDLLPAATAAAEALRWSAGGRFLQVSVSAELAESGRVDEAAERAGADLSPAEESALVHAALPLGRRAEVRMVASLRHLPDNWFSHWHAEERTVVSSLWGWEQTAAVAREAFLAYEMVLYGLHALSPRYDFLAFAHEETRGCLFDFCGLRADIEIKLQTADLCPQCHARLDAARIPPTLVQELCETIRSLATPRRAAARPDARPHA